MGSRIRKSNRRNHSVQVEAYIDESNFPLLLYQSLFQEGTQIMKERAGLQDAQWHPSRNSVPVVKLKNGLCKQIKALKGGQHEALGDIISFRSGGETNNSVMILGKDV